MSGEDGSPKCNVQCRVLPVVPADRNQPFSIGKQAQCCVASWNDIILKELKRILNFEKYLERVYIRCDSEYWSGKYKSVIPIPIQV